PCVSFRDRYGARARARERCLLPAGVWGSAHEPCGRPADPVIDTCSRIEWDRKGVEVVMAKGSVRARAAIVTVSTNLLTAGKIVFKPELSKRLLDAAAALTLGSYDHIALEMPGNPINLQRDELVFEKSSSRQTAALLANVSGSSLHLVEVAGVFGRDLSEKGKAAMIEFARDWVASLFGTGVKNKIKRSYATRWNEEPFSLG